LTVWRHRCGVPVRYRLENWAMVFPLGMYTTATWRFADTLGLPFLDIVPALFVWVAVAAWCLNFIGLLFVLTSSPRESAATE
jgi:tellurite resistance protein TehA-like permease